MATTSVFLYEHLTGGGLLGAEAFAADSVAQYASFLREGSAMIAALAEDFSCVPGVTTSVLRDARLRDLRLPANVVHEVASASEAAASFDRLVKAADWTLLVAPEIEGVLLTLAERVTALGGRLLSPSCELITLAANKQRTAEWLHGRGVPTPHGRLLSAGQLPPENFRYPAVLKPNDGAGSMEMQYIADAQTSVRPNRLSRLEEFHPGLPASVAAIGGPGGVHLLPACVQRLSNDGRFTYLGGDAPLPPPQAARAARLARAALAALPPLTGYLGMDLVLGEANDRHDVVVEINPRLTTSYIGLRRLATNNLASAMLDSALGRPYELSFRAAAVEFEACGRVTIEPLMDTPLTARPARKFSCDLPERRS